MITEILRRYNELGDFRMSLVGTEEGLLLGFSGDVVTSEELAGFTSLFNGVVDRAERNLDMHRVDELTLLDPSRGRIVIRPVVVDNRRIFIVVRLPHNRSWRRNTNRLCTEITQWLRDRTAS